jgi:hypothetical protein
MRTIPCHCENSVEIDLPEVIDLSADPGYYDKILDGSFQSVTCPQCGSLIKPEVEVRLTDPGCQLDLFFIPETQRGDFINGRISSPASSVVIGYPELVERIRLVKSAIDPGAVEILKYFLKKKLVNDDVTVFFTQVEGDFLLFQVLGLKENEVAATRLPVKVYQDTLASLDKKKDDELFKTILNPPYVSVNKVSILEEND